MSRFHADMFSKRYVTLSWGCWCYKEVTGPFFLLFQVDNVVFGEDVLQYGHSPLLDDSC